MTAEPLEILDVVVVLVKSLGLLKPSLSQLLLGTAHHHHDDAASTASAKPPTNQLWLLFLVSE